MSTNICEPVNGLKLDAQSIKQLQRMKDLDKSGKFINSLLGANIFLSIMGGKSPTGLPSTNVDKLWTISQTDWDGYVRAMETVPTVFKKQIEKEAEALAVEYAFPAYNCQLHQFWKGIANGGKY